MNESPISPVPMLLRLWCFLGLCGLLAYAGGRAAPPKYRLETGLLEGAHYTVAVPARWNRQMLLLAPDQRPEAAPLVAPLDPEQPDLRALLAEGWLIATTSYRRNGLIIADAMDDLDALRAHLGRTHGTPSRVLLAGTGLGGRIVLQMAERKRELYAGALVIDALFDLEEVNVAAGLTLQPHIPVLFVANWGEVRPAQQYILRVPAQVEDTLVAPLLAQVTRPGHDNLNAAERLAALRLLLHWLDHDREALVSPAQQSRAIAGAPWRPLEGTAEFDLTQEPASRPAAVRWLDDRSFTTRILAIAPFFGQLTLDARPEDLARLGIGKIGRLQLQVGERTWRVLYGRDLTGVARGEWAAFPDADGTIRLARREANAAATAACQVGDTVTLRRYGSSPAPESAP